MKKPADKLSEDKDYALGVEITLYDKLPLPRTLALYVTAEALGIVLAAMLVLLIAVNNGCEKRAQQDDTEATSLTQTQEDDGKAMAGFLATTEAPVNDAILNDADTERDMDYILRFQSVAIAEHRKYNIPASVKMAQGLIESAAGTSKMAVEINNHFGMKCFSRNCKKGHCSNFHDDSHKDFFRKFDSAWASWRAHSQLLTGERYAHLPAQCGTDYKCWAKGLKNAGYATDKNYAQKLIGRIEKYRLYELDKGKTFTQNQ